MTVTIGIILAAGVSKRFNSESHKQYLKLNGKEVVYYSIMAMRNAEEIQDFVVVVDDNEYNEGYISNKYSVVCVRGGLTRNESIANAFDYVKDHYIADNIVIQDSSRPFVSPMQFNECVRLLDEYDAVAVSAPIIDGLMTNNLGEVKRDDYVLIRTPEAFRTSVFEKLFNRSITTTTSIAQMDKCKRYLLSSNMYNFKITYPEDLFLAEQLVRISYETSKTKIAPKINGTVLLLGGSGGVGQTIRNYLEDNNIQFVAPTHQELDLEAITVDKICKYMPFNPDVIINASAAYANDDVDPLESFDTIMNVNLKANLVLMKYALSIKKRVNIVFLSSSSCTRGRVNLTNYSASKAALNSIIESQCEHLAKNNVFINAVIPEKINTPLIQKLHSCNINKRELLEPDEVLAAIVKYSMTTDYGKLVHLRKGL